jgi:predicted transcriptional regulator
LRSRAVALFSPWGPGKLKGGSPTVGLPMSEATIVVSEAARQKLQELAVQSGRSVSEVLERAVEEFHSRQFWEAVNRGYAELRADPEAWAAEVAERRAWDGSRELRDEEARKRREQ